MPSPLPTFRPFHAHHATSLSLSLALSATHCFLIDSNCGLGDARAASLADTIPIQNSLTHVNLTDNRMTARSIVPLMGRLMLSPLCLLDLSNNHIGAKVRASIALEM